MPLAVLRDDVLRREEYWPRADENYNTRGVIRFLGPGLPAGHTDQNLIEVTDDTLADGVALSPNAIPNVLRQLGKVGFSLEFSWVQFGFRHRPRRLTGRA